MKPPKIPRRARSGGLPAALLCAVQCATLLASPAEEGSAGAQRMVVSLTHRNRPVALQGSFLTGSIVVRGGGSSEVLIEVLDGEPAAPVLDAREHENRVVVKSRWGTPLESLLITVPRETSVKLGCVRACAIEVRDVQGELELNSADGPVVAEGISGSVVATAINGDLRISFDRVDAGRPMSFVTFNGDSEVTFPPGLSAEFLISQALGGTQSEFDLTVVQRSHRMETARGGAARDMKLLEETRARVGGGGAEIRFETWRGDILIRKGEPRAGGPTRRRP